MPMQGPDGHSMDASYMGEGPPRHYGAGFNSSEPTMRAEEAGGAHWEVQRENQVLKDLVERLHLELEEAVKREARWKHKVAKLKARPPSAHPGAPQPPSLPPPAQASAPYGSGGPWPGSYQTQASPMKGLEEMAASSSSAQKQAYRSFHANRREPTLAEIEAAAQDAAMNQGGLLSLSSISPQHSQPAPQESMEGMGVSGTETARSTDSGMLPQRLEKRVIRPAHVPSLDFSRLKNPMEEEEEEMEEEMEGQEEYDEDGDVDQLPMRPLELGSDSGYSPRDDESDLNLEGMPVPVHGGVEYQYAEAAPESDGDGDA
eukprot:TRINITY_DN16193_c0_g1_i1.p1 TRINITY_DN16193_c0_g1~~TRINITY_DN16193_c0_g1_i1.p1  ORF type:complete len:316 (-),score=83.80 TRINITY_DN16193_c0_g1_i1:91-1038(-)